MTQEESEAKHKSRRDSLTKTIEDIQKEESANAQTGKKKIEGFEMAEEKQEDTKMTASGSEWMVMVIAVGFLALLLIGWKKKRV